MPSAVAPLPTISLLAGHPAPKEMLVDLTGLEREYDARHPDIDDPTQLVSFGTEGFRDSDHLDAIVGEAREMVDHALAS